MKTQSYTYTPHVRTGSIDYSYRPLLEVEVGGPHQSRRFKALVDSGTDVTVMDSVIAELLGLATDDRTPATVSGVGQSQIGFIAPVSIKVERFPDKVFNFEVIFVESLSNNFDIILGQQDFFANFNVTFKRSQNIFFLELVR
jgi:hypothetical protein